MVLNDPPILMSLAPWSIRRTKSVQEERFDYWMYNKNDYYCIDGFPQDGDPCVVVLPPPFRQGFVYQGIKPAVLPVDNCPERVLLHVRQKQEELLEKLKLKRQQSVEEDKPVEPSIVQAPATF